MLTEWRKRRGFKEGYLLGRRRRGCHVKALIICEGYAMERGRLKWSARYALKVFSRCLSVLVA